MIPVQNGCDDDSPSNEVIAFGDSGEPCVLINGQELHVHPPLKDIQKWNLASPLSMTGFPLFAQVSSLKYPYQLADVGQQ